MKFFANNFAIANISGSKDYPTIRGKVSFIQRKNSVLVMANIHGLPYSKEKCKEDILAFHIHEGESCDGSIKEPFSETKGHYNPQGCPHPYHPGDMPPLFSNSGYAFLSFLTDRFSVDEIIGKTVVIHKGTDDFRSQPSGDSGEKIACGEISQQ
ncbi:MAG: superoxide dismutase family protein [Eubacteriales bacterium]|nr:superoxide dismutase family protein [Eubacteriales bacterium]